MASTMNGDRNHSSQARQLNGAAARASISGGLSGGPSGGSSGCKVVNGSGEDQETPEMLAEERDLAEDAPWKRIQQNTFTRWVNEHLKKVEKNVGALDGDLSDGLLLIALIEVLSGKRMPRHNKRPSFRSQKLENVSVALKFLEHDERIKIVNIDSSHIVDCQLKLILGLIWTLILHYSISMPMWDGEEDVKESTPKQRLMNWVQSKLPGLPVKNFTSDWGDGKAIGALVDGVAPGLCPDWPEWEPEDALKNTTEAMTLADDWLSVPQLIRPEDMIDPNVDDLSMMTYLSQYPNAKLKPNAPLRPRFDPNRVKCYGRGVEPSGVVAGYSAQFVVDTELAGTGNVQCSLETPDRSVIPIDITTDDKTPSLHRCTYTPLSPGKYRVHVKFNGVPIAQSPYNVAVQGSAGDPDKVTVSGPGVERDGVVVGRPTYFNIYTKDAGVGTPEVAILCPDEKQLGSSAVSITEVQTGEYRCEYRTNQTGLHSVNVFFAGKQIPNSPFGANVKPVSDARKVRVLGRGIQSRGIRCGESATLKLVTKGAGEGEASVQVIGPDEQSGTKLPVKLAKVDEETYDVSYMPVKEGRHIVMVTYGGDEVPNSPFEVNVAPNKECAVRCFGAGLSTGLVNKPAVFTVDTNGETGALGFNIAGMSRADISCHDNGDGSVKVTYKVTAPGEYAVHVLCDGEDVLESPWMAQIMPTDDSFDPEKVKVYGEGVENKGVVEQKSADFTIETVDAGDASLSVQVTDGSLRPVAVQVSRNSDDVYTAQYTPQTPGKHNVQVTYGGMEVPGSPFRVSVARAVRVSPELVRVYTPLDRGASVTALTPCSIDIDAREAGPGDVAAVMTNMASGDIVPIKLRPKGDGTFVAECVPPTAGHYTLEVSHGGLHVPQSPIVIDVKPGVDLSKIKVDGLDSDVFANSPADIRVDTSALPVSQRQGHVKGIVEDSRGNRFAAVVEEKKEEEKDGVHALSFTPTEPGVYKVDLFYNEQHLSECSRSVTCVEGNDPSRVRAYGDGLQRAVTDKVNTFTVNTRGAGSGGLGLSVEGPSQVVINCEDKRDGTCLVQYTPTAPGDYDVFVKFAGENITGSPFNVRAYADGDASTVRAFGPALEPNQCRAGTTQTFTVDATKAAPAPIGVQVTCDQGTLMQMPKVHDKEDGTYEVTFAAPSCAKKCRIDVKHAGDHIPGSPFSVPLKPVSECERVIVSGPGVSGDVRASLPTSFTVDARDAGSGKLQAQISDPDGDIHQLPLSQNVDGTVTAHYTPTDCGTYQLQVRYDGTPVPGSPFPVEVQPTGDASKCRIKQRDQESTSIAPGQQQRVEVDAKEAGHGRVTCRVKSEKYKHKECLECSVQEVRPGVFHALYTPRDTADHTVDIKFGGRPVPGGFYTVKCMEVSESVSETFSRQSFSESHCSVIEESICEQNYRPLQFAAIPLPESLGTLTADVKQPSGDIAAAEVCDNRNGTATVTYQPTQHGKHQLSVKHNKQHVPDSPFFFVVEPPAPGVVTAEGPGLVEGVAGELANFTVCTRNVDAGGLSLAVEGPSKAEIICHDNEDGTMSVSYLPTVPGQYVVSVQFTGRHIAGSPFTVKIRDGGKHRNQVSMGDRSEMALPGEITATDIQALSAKIRTPSGLVEPCFLKCLSNDHLGVSFTPREVGEHQVFVRRGDTEIAGSPFTVAVTARQVGDASKVRVTGEALQRGRTHCDNQLCIDTREAGFGGLSMSVEGPSKAEIKCDDRQDGKLYVSYHPKEPGQYKLNLKFADHHVEGSPFLVEVTGEGANRLREHVLCERRAPTPSSVGSQCAFTFKMADAVFSELTASVEAPSGALQSARVRRDPSDSASYTVEFQARELGVHTVSVRYQGAHIPGSPFQFTVGPLTGGGARHVRASGPGLERAKQNVLNEFDVWAREAGAGTLLISAEGPSKAEIDFRERDDGSCYVGYLVTEPGEYSIGVKFNDENIPGSPFIVYVAPNDADAANVVVKNLPAHVAEVNQPVTFSVSSAGVQEPGGQLECRLAGPDGSVDDCYLALQPSPGHHTARCVPRQRGTHHVHVTWNGMHVPGSPFRLLVGEGGPGGRGTQPQVRAHGAGLSRGQVGAMAQFIVDTCSAEPGTLAVTVDGPSKVELNCTEIAEGFLVGYTPLCRGVYTVGVKYNDEHIVDSPFNATITGGDAVNGRDHGHQQARVVVHSAGQVSDLAPGQVRPVSTLPTARNSVASRVVCEGEGLTQPRIGDNTFFVDTSDAGIDVLWVGCYAAGGSLCRPCDHVTLQHVKSGQYRVQYRVSTRGSYLLLVRWGDTHVPGSPFQICV